MIGDTAYESLWYDLKPHQNRDLLFMIVRSQKHLTLTVGKFMDLSLIQFSNVRSQCHSGETKRSERKRMSARGCARSVIANNVLTTGRCFLSVVSSRRAMSRTMAVIVVYRVVDRESLGVIRVGVTRDVLRHRCSSPCAAYIFACERR